MQVSAEQFWASMDFGSWFSGDDAGAGRKRSWAMSTGIDPQDLRQRVIRPVTLALGLGGDAVEELLLGTALQESGCGRRLSQVGGPALGLWQMEPETHDDLWANFLISRSPLAQIVLTWTFTGLPKAIQMIGNLYYACAMARVQYFRSPKAIPAKGDLQAQAEFYKTCYNTPKGAATVEEYIANCKGVLHG